MLLWSEAWQNADWHGAFEITVSFVSEICKQREREIRVALDLAWAFETSPPTQHSDILT